MELSKMQRLNVHLFINDYLYLKANNIQISQLCRNLVKTHIDIEASRQKENDIENVEENIKILQDKFNTIKLELTIKKTQILKLKEEEMKEQTEKAKEELREQETLAKAIIDQGIFERSIR